MTTAIGNDYRSELFRELATRHEELGEARGEVRGEARGEGRAVLTVLGTRGIPVSVTIREQILACTDLTQLDTWLRQALTVTTAEELLSG